MRRRLVRLAALALLGLAPAGVIQGAAAAQSLSRLYLGVDRSHILEVGDPARKVAVANPNIADVQVMNPNQLLVNGKAVGVTSLVVFYAKSEQSFDLVVHPGPVGAAGSPTLVTRDPHAVWVQRGDKMTEQLFTREREHWLELGQVKPETDTGKK